MAESAKRRRERREKAKAKAKSSDKKVDSETQMVEDEPDYTDAVPEPEQRPQSDPVVPYRIQFNFTGATREQDAGDLIQIMDIIEEEAEARGFYPEWKVITPMDPDDIVVGSDLDKQVSGSDHG